MITHAKADGGAFLGVGYRRAVSLFVIFGYYKLDFCRSPVAHALGSTSCGHARYPSAQKYTVPVLFRGFPYESW